MLHTRPQRHVGSTHPSKAKHAFREVTSFSSHAKSQNYYWEIGEPFAAFHCDYFRKWADRSPLFIMTIIGKSVNRSPLFIDFGKSVNGLLFFTISFFQQILLYMWKEAKYYKQKSNLSITPSPPPPPSLSPSLSLCSYQANPPALYFEYSYRFWCPRGSQRRLEVPPRLDPRLQTYHQWPH